MKQTGYTIHVIEHHIQRNIMDRLMHASGLRFSELKPAGMESNIFMYHLKQLTKDGYVMKQDKIYALAAKGLTYVDGLSTRNNRPAPQPKLIAIIALSDDKGNWLLAERKVQPYIGQRMFPSGKQHRGETSAEHAVRELKEKTGLSGIPLKLRGVADVQISDQSGTLVTHAVANVYQGTLNSDVLPAETDRFRYVWHDFNDRDVQLMPGTQTLYEQMRRNEQFTISLAEQQI